MNISFLSPLFQKDNCVNTTIKEPAKPKESAWRGLRVSTETLSDALEKSFAALVLGYLFEASPKLSPMSPLFYGLGASLLTTTVAVKVISYYNISYVEGLKRKTCQFKEQYPNLQIIAFLFAMILVKLLPLLGFLTAAAIGVYDALTTDIDQCKHAQGCIRNDPSAAA